MIEAIHEEHLRVTSIKYSTPNYAIFCGVPIDKKSFSINDGKYYVTIKSSAELLPVSPALGQHWKVTGPRKIQEQDNDGYVMQEHVYKSFEHIECSLPSSNEELINFIANEKEFQGIGPDKARKLCIALGRDFHKILSKDNLKSREQLRERFRKSNQSELTEHSINILFSGYSKYKNLAHCNWMSDHKIPRKIQHRLLKYHDEKAITAIKKNPYILVSFGMTFQEVDHLVSNSNFKSEITDYDHRRLSAALEYALRKRIRAGDTYMTQKELRPILMRLFKDDKELVSAAFRAGYSNAQYVLNPEAGYYHPTAQLLMENVVAKRLKLLAKENNLYDENANNAYCSAVDEIPYPLTKKQSTAITTCLDNAVSCITGGAGTGKTTILRAVLRAYHQLGFDIHAVALSGRAAMRLHESIGFETSTIAKFLRSTPIQPDLVSQKHVLVIDEASMIDIPTMYRLVTHIAPSVRIIFTGDPDQLPPIGAGKVLADIVDSEAIANTKLDIPKRQEASTGIPEYSVLINQGIVPENLSTGGIYFHETKDKDIIDACSELFAQAPFDSRIVAPQKALVKELNDKVQEFVNPDADLLQVNLAGQFQFVKFRRNDEIMFDKNHYNRGIRNGTLGTLTSVQSQDGYYGEVTLDTNNQIKIDDTIFECMNLGYAITLHKAQGSQFKRVIIALPSIGTVADRAWLYTAITRAEAEVHIVSTSDVFKNHVKEPSKSHSRNSYLLNLLKI